MEGYGVGRGQIEDKTAHLVLRLQVKEVDVIVETQCQRMVVVRIDIHCDRNGAQLCTKLFASIACSPYRQLQCIDKDDERKRRGRVSRQRVRAKPKSDVNLMKRIFMAPLFLRTRAGSGLILTEEVLLFAPPPAMRSPRSLDHRTRVEMIPSDPKLRSQRRRSSRDRSSRIILPRAPHFFKR